jgi:hypothetical protein
MPAKDLITKQATTGAGSWVRINESAARTVQVVISGVASVDIEGSNNGVDPCTLQAGVNASSGFTDAESWMFLRANVKSISSGTVSVILGEQ